MLKAVFLDFYGTVVHEDNAIIKIINKRIFQSGIAEKVSDIGAYWWNDFQKMFIHSRGESFKTQRELERESLKNTINYFKSSEDVNELSELLFKHWINPPIFKESKEFFKTCPVPIYIVSNIDTRDIMEALAFHNLQPDDVITSEDARSYKPQKEIFDFALQKTKLSSHDVLHIGDSITSDVNGANSAGIEAIWLNRFGREIPLNVKTVVLNLMDVLATEYFK